VDAITILRFRQGANLFGFIMTASKTNTSYMDTLIEKKKPGRRLKDDCADHGGAAVSASIELYSLTATRGAAGTGAETAFSAGPSP